MASKRKAESIAVDAAAEDSDDSDYAPSAIDVSFDYVSPTEIDFAALKRLSQQLFSTHSIELNLAALVDDIISWGMKESIGTVVKVEDDEDADPFAFASVINLASPSSSAIQSEGSKSLRAYYKQILNTSTASSSKSAQSINGLLNSSTAKPLQIFHERMINLPPQIMPPLYRMLFDEVAANADLDAATHLVFFSRVFSTAAFADESEEEEGSSQLQKNTKRSNGKKQKKATPKNKAIGKMKTNDETGEEEMGLFHPEDAILAKYALYSFTYRFPAPKDSDDSFNAPMYARIAVVKRDKETLRAFLQDIEAAFAVPV
ncbi:hypothetical protein CBS101457_002519 [Exobasidium rhododendri]|nr:hypothetical protein CBS101457_002519 [Exobasidium rhododendri]